LWRSKEKNLSVFQSEKDGRRADFLLYKKFC